MKIMAIEKKAQNSDEWTQSVYQMCGQVREMFKAMLNIENSIFDPSKKKEVDQVTGTIRDLAKEVYTRADAAVVRAGSAEYLQKAAQETPREKMGAALIKLDTGEKVVTTMISCSLQRDTEESIKEHMFASWKGIYPEMKILGIEIVPDSQRPTQEEMDQIENGIPNRFEISKI
jgi:hypothetical protein